MKAKKGGVVEIKNTRTGQTYTIPTHKQYAELFQDKDADFRLFEQGPVTKGNKFQSKGSGTNYTVTGFSDDNVVVTDGTNIYTFTPDRYKKLFNGDQEFKAIGNQLVLVGETITVSNGEQSFDVTVDSFTGDKVKFKEFNREEEIADFAEMTITLKG